MSGLAGPLAEFAAGLAVEAVPEPAQAAARRSILDGLAVAVAGSDSDTARRSRAALLEAGGGTCTVLGTGHSTAPSTAALLNGIAAHALDFDDVWADDDGVVAWRGHPTVCVLPAVLAAAERVGASGQSVLLGYVIGAEVAGKLGTAFGPALGRVGWHPTIVLGTIAAAAAAGRVLGLDRARLGIALGIAATEAAGLHRNFGTDTKPFHAGHAARCGVDAALLASTGFTANPAAVDDYLRVFGGDRDRAASVIAGLGSGYDLVRPGLSIKKYPCCRFAHLPLDAILAISAGAGLSAGEVSSITVRIEPGADDALVCPAARTGLEAKFSMPYLLAAAAVDGRINLASFSDAAVARPELQALMLRVVTEYREGPGAEVEIRTPSGVRSETARIVKGDPANPLTPAEELEKCRSCLEPVVGPRRAESLAASVANLAAMASVRELTAECGSGVPSLS